jgi:putative heme transporter
MLPAAAQDSFVRVQVPNEELGMTTPSGPGAGAGAGQSPHRVWWSWRRWAAGVAAVGLLAVAVLAERPLLGESIHSFGHLRWLSVFWAVVAEIGSMIFLALMERRILILAGHRLPVGRAIAIAYASNAVSQSLPVVGAGAATAYSYRRLVSHGAAPALAGWTLTLAGIVSNVAFVVIICIGGLVSGNTFAVIAGGAGLVLSVLVIAVAVIAVRRPAVRERVMRAAVWTLRWVQRLIRRPAGDAAGIVVDTMASLAAFRPSRRDVVRVTALAFRNWAFDLLCLAFSIKAAGAHVPWWGIVLAWAAGSGGASLNLTPGGLGVVEVALTGALVALGVPSEPALTAVLVYRAITFWLAIAIGWPIYWRLRREHELVAVPTAEAAAEEAPAEE